MRPHPAALALALSVALASQATAQVAPASDTTQSPVIHHTVKRGDTLWDIAKFYLKNPFLWPEVFHVNTDVVKNPHWIYPGQVLSIPRTAVRDEVAARADKDGFVQDRGLPPATNQRTTFASNAPLISRQSVAMIASPAAYTIRKGEYDAAPFVVDQKHPPAAGAIVGAVERSPKGLTSDAGYKLYDRLYVTLPLGYTVRPGDELLLAERGDVILDVGQVIEPRGILRITAVQTNGPVQGEIVRQFGVIHQDQLILPYDRTFTPTTVRPTRGNYSIPGKVLWIRQHPPLPSLQTYLVIDAHSADVRPGDEFTLYDQAESDSAAEISPVEVARAQVLRTTPQGITGIIVRQSQARIEEGMRVQLTAKMP